MPIQNLEISEAFDEVADLLEIQGANPYRVRAYRNAARVIGGWPERLEEVSRTEGRLPKMPGIGADLSAKIEQLIRSGKLGILEEIREQVPHGLLALLRIPSLGPKRVRALQDRLGVRTLGDLERVAKSGELENLPGFGVKIRDTILAQFGGAAGRPKAKIRYMLILAEQIVKPLLEYLEAIPGVRKVRVAGSFRRRMETVGDLDILATCQRGREVMERFVAYEDAVEVLSQGDTRSTIRLRSGIQVDLRVVPEAGYGAALHYFTGSKDHNIAIRTIGVRRGLKINEYGIFKGARRVAGEKEDDVFRSVGLPFIEPELREGRGEIEAAGEGRLPKLLTLRDIRGDLHAHSHATDGRLGIRQMAEAAIRRGYRYLAITDHSKHLTVARGLDRKRLIRQIREIDRLNEQLGKIAKNFRILRGTEVDILEDGNLDLSDDVLKELDVRVCSIHYRFDLSEKKQTERVIRAMDNPYFNILAHPTGRLITWRRPYEVALERVMRAARERGCFLEINSQPERMDLNDLHCQAAKSLGVKLAISTDAHGDTDLDYMRFGVDQARRGWIEADDVINTRPLKELLSLFKGRQRY